MACLLLEFPRVLEWPPSLSFSVVFLARPPLVLALSLLWSLAFLSVGFLSVLVPFLPCGLSGPWLPLVPVLFLALVSLVLLALACLSWALLSLVALLGSSLVLLLALLGFLVLPSVRGLGPLAAGLAVLLGSLPWP